MRAAVVASIAVAACATAAPPDPAPVTATRVAVSRDLQAGDARIDGSFLAPYASKWKIGVTLADGRTRDDADWSDELAVVEVGGRRALQRTQHESEDVTDEEVHPGLAKKIGKERLEVTYVNVFDPKTLAPIETRIESNLGRTMRLAYDGAHVTGEKVGWTPSPLAVDDRLTAAPYDFHGGTYGLVLAALTDPGGYRGRLAAYAIPRGTESKGALDWLDLRAQEIETIDAGSLGKRQARVLSITDGHGGTFRFWVAREPPYVLHVTLEEPEAKQLWTYRLL
jgi:hypothetical protein